MRKAASVSSPTTSPSGQATDSQPTLQPSPGPHPAKAAKRSCDHRGPYASAGTSASSSASPSTASPASAPPTCILKPSDKEKPIAELAHDGHQGAAVALARHWKGLVFCTKSGPDRRIYAYDDESAVWQKNPDLFPYEALVRIFGATFIDDGLGSIINFTDGDTQDLITEMALKYLVEPSMEQRIDATAHLMPMYLSNLVMDLRTGISRTRTKEDYISEELAEWDPDDATAVIDDPFRKLDSGDIARENYVKRLIEYNAVRVDGITWGRPFEAKRQLPPPSWTTDKLSKCGPRGMAAALARFWKDTLGLYCTTGEHGDIKDVYSYNHNKARWEAGTVESLDAGRDLASIFGRESIDDEHGLVHFDNPKVARSMAKEALRYLVDNDRQNAVDHPTTHRGEHRKHRDAKRFAVHFLNAGGVVLVKSSCARCRTTCTTRFCLGCVGPGVGPVVFRKERTTFTWNASRSEFDVGRVDIGGLDARGMVIVALEIKDTHATDNVAPRSGLVSWAEVSAAALCSIIGAGEDDPAERGVQCAVELSIRVDDLRRYDTCFSCTPVPSPTSRK
jgi:hypothetical protein